ncbi:acid-sensing ion channel 5-like [Watersipora subatra]|uniref:acid-sensing ion channel 5-like n=1 Tax=Watersipora subatra TaxID=2589382 RepID=UPI00355B9FB7
MIKQCGCPFAGIHTEKPWNYNGPFCLQNYCNVTLLTQQATCINNVLNQLESHQLCHSCKMPNCLSWMFEDRHAAIDYFINSSTSDFAEDFLDKDHPAINDMNLAFGNLSNAPRNFIASNFAKVTITFANLHIKHRVAVSSMSSFSLFADLGGAFSFWVGCSIITFVEILEWIIRMAFDLRNNSLKLADGNNSAKENNFAEE